MKNKIANITILVGVVLLLAALSLFIYNQFESYAAAKSSRDTLVRLEAAITASNQDATVDLPQGFFPDKDTNMAETEIDGNSYIGYLSLPTLDLNLPIMADWSYKKLKIAPCRYYGSVQGENLVLMAHNYPRHFGRISKLSIGDKLIFTDINGVVTEYSVVGRDVLDPYASEEMIAGDFDLTLFTCTYGGQSRVTLYCNRT